ncbi:hypothetical protein B0T22DRAFT_439005 [Podospora appendiculata]|uniref:4'-phosphopantetheinyl transferase domain-containing protein n=1 Tax=Podospora appendiculata TaxID=314037 RepID=A0AAE1CBD8_9PEZI|nr:hypothetical protein B0T22DRAFT_439005 [Podospora appendiculata]
MSRRILPFPSPISVGTDICRLERIRTILAGPRGEKFITRILAPEELENSRERDILTTTRNAAAALDEKDDSFEHQARFHRARIGGNNGYRGPTLDECSKFMAGRFAAKEAAIKAHPHRRLTFHDIVIRRLENVSAQGGGGSGPPVAVIKGAPGCLSQVARMSISHDGGYATAVCLGFDPALAYSVAERRGDGGEDEDGDGGAGEGGPAAG